MDIEEETELQEHENFIHTKFGYCYYSLDSTPFIWNLYVHPKYRRQGHSRILLQNVISEIRKNGCYGEISILAEPREESVGLVDLINYYRSIGLKILTQIKQTEQYCEGVEIFEKEKEV